MQPHEQRVVAEKEALDAKLTALSEFIASYSTSLVFAELSMDEKQLLVDQYFAMVRYSDILGKRIALFASYAAASVS